MLQLGKLYCVLAQTKKTRTADQAVVWERQELIEPMKGYFMGYRRVKEGAWQLANVGGLDGWAEHFKATREFEVALFVIHPRRNPIRALESDVKEIE